MVEFNQATIMSLLGTILILLLFALIAEFALRRFRPDKLRMDYYVVQTLTDSLKGIPFGLGISFSIYFLLDFFGVNLVLITDEGLLYLLVVFLLILFLSRFTTGLISRADTSKDRATGLSIVTNLVRFVIYGVGMLIVFETLGIKVTPLLTALGLGGLAIALALQNTLSNLFAGLYLIATKDFHKGEFIRLDSGEEGYIEDINWRHTTIRSYSKHKIIVPNFKLSNATITKFYIDPQTNAIIFSLGIGYQSDLDKVEQIAVEVAQTTIREIQGQDPPLPPFVRYRDFAPYSIDLQIVVYARNFGDRALIRHQLIKNIFKRFNEENIDIPYPTSVIVSKTD